MYMIRSFGFGGEEDITDIKTLKEARKILRQKKREFEEEYEVADYDDWHEEDNWWSFGRCEEGYTIYEIIKVPEFKNDFDKLIWEAKQKLDFADYASTDYSYSLMDNCVSDYTYEARELIDQAIKSLGR